MRILLGGLLGSLLILLAITPVSTWASHPLTKAVFSVLMVLIAFGYKRMSTYISTLFTFYFSTFLMGGILIGVHFFLTFNLELKSIVILESIRGYGDPISWLFIMGAFPVAWYFSKKRLDGLTMTNIQYDVLYDVSIKINGILIEIKGLIDSGNQLYDPISRKPVIIVSVVPIKDEVPDEILLVADENNDLFTATAQLPVEWSDLMRLIPAKTLGNNNQLLCAFKPEFISVKDPNGREAQKDALLVFTTQKLSSDDAFQCILHPKMAVDLVHSAS